jgi:hypothetical protein
MPRHFFAEKRKVLAAVLCCAVLCCAVLCCAEFTLLHAFTPSAAAASLDVGIVYNAVDFMSTGPGRFYLFRFAKRRSA